MSGRGQFRGRGRGRGEISLPTRPRGGGSQQAGRGYRGGFRGGRGGGPNRELRVYKPEDGSRPTLDEATLIHESKHEVGNTGAAASMPRRPGYGTIGRETMLWANYLQLFFRGDLTFHRYDLSITEAEKGTAPKPRTYRRLVKLFFEQFFAEQMARLATDFRSIVISKEKLNVSNEGYRTKDVVKRAKGESTSVEYNIRFAYGSTLNLSHLLDYLKSNDPKAFLGSKDEIIQALNIIIGFYPKVSDNVTSIGSNKHFHLNTDISQRKELGYGLAVVTGFFLSVRAASTRLLLNIQPRDMVFYQSGLLSDILQRLRRVNQGPSGVVTTANFVKKMSVEIIYNPKKDTRGRDIPQVRTVTGFAAPGDGAGELRPPHVSVFGASANQIEFFNSSKGSNAGKYIKVVDYFRQEHKISLSCPHLPVLNIGSRQKPVYVPPELCRVQPGNVWGKELDGGLTKQMQQFAVRQPYDNAALIVQKGHHFADAKATANHTMAAFGIEAPARLTATQGRILPIPRIQYRPGNPFAPQRGSWNMRNVRQLALKKDLVQWYCLVIRKEGASNGMQQPEFEENLVRFCDAMRQIGMRVEKPVKANIVINDKNWAETIGQMIVKLVNLQGPKILFVILPDEESKIYNLIKRKCDIEHGIINVCCQAKKFVKGSADTFSNMALKLNLKLGGRNHTLADKELPIISEGKTMLVGVDVTHPSPDSLSTAPSVAAVVASVDKHCAQFPAALSVQTARTEMVAALKELFKSRLKLWQERNMAALPDNIIVFRDGVSEGEYQRVLDAELSQLREGCREIYPAPRSKAGYPRISVVIMGKRHHTRFYPTVESQASDSSNPVNGTVVDRSITESRNWDFFLQSHHAIQGTARPAHYFVIHDEVLRSTPITSKMNTHGFRNPSDVLQHLVHALCYTFGRATKAVSLCPPAYYADLVCERARRYLARHFDPDSSSSSSSSGTGDAAEIGLLNVHPAVKDSMFYI